MEFFIVAGLAFIAVIFFVGISSNEVKEFRNQKEFFSTVAGEKQSPFEVFRLRIIVCIGALKRFFLDADFNQTRVVAVVII